MEKSQDMENSSASKTAPEVHLLRKEDALVISLDDASARPPETGIKPRYAFLDRLRGMTLISMILFHGTWDLVYLFHVPWSWFTTSWAFLWQQSICWTFILLSGFCFSLGHHAVRRGIVVCAASLLVSLASTFAGPDARILFGVLTLLGSSMILTAALAWPLNRIPPAAGLLLSSLLFAFTRNINSGFLGISSHLNNSGFLGIQRLECLMLPEQLYSNFLTTYLGFPMAGFYSADYFSLFPWYFLFLVGFFLYGLCRDRGLFSPSGPSGSYAPSDSSGLSDPSAPPTHCSARRNCASLANSLISRCDKGLLYLGRHSLEAYLLHQPLLYALFWLIFTFINQCR